MHYRRHLKELRKEFNSFLRDKRPDLEEKRKEALSSIYDEYGQDRVEMAWRNEHLYVDGSEHAGFGLNTRTGRRIPTRAVIPNINVFKKMGVDKKETNKLRDEFLLGKGAKSMGKTEDGRPLYRVGKYVIRLRGDYMEMFTPKSLNTK